MSDAATRAQVSQRQRAESKGTKSGECSSTIRIRVAARWLTLRLLICLLCLLRCSCMQSGGVGAVPSRVNEGSPLLSHDFTRSSSGSMIDSHASGSVRGVPGYPATMGAHVEAATGQPARSAPASAPVTDPALPRWRDDQAEQIRADEAFARSLADEQQQLYGRGEWADTHGRQQSLIVQVTSPRAPSPSDSLHPLLAL